MEDAHRQAIRKNFSSLVIQTNFEVMRDALIEKGIFTEHMIANYAGELSVMNKKRMMYNDIMRRGPRAFGILLETLEENGYWDLVRMLDNNSTLNTVSNAGSIPLYDDRENRYVSLSVQRNTTQAVADPVPITESIVCPPAAPQNHQISFQVIKSTRFVEDNESNDLRLYRTRGRQRGVLLVLSYINFKDGVEDYRAGAEIDSFNLKYLFSEIGFKVLAFQDLTYQETLNTLDELKHVLVPGLESVFVVVSSHGYERVGSSDTDIRCHDGQLISLRDIIAYFSNSRLPHLRDVPKVFIFQICRGKNEDYVNDGSAAGPPAPLSMPTATDGHPYCADTAAPARAATSMALYTNILVVQSTLPGFVSRRDPKHGSWYIQVLCEKFAERAHDCHVDKLFTMVDERLKERFHIQTSSVDRWGFNRRLYLHPGLFE